MRSTCSSPWERTERRSKTRPSFVSGGRRAARTPRSRGRPARDFMPGRRTVFFHFTFAGAFLIARKRPSRRARIRRPRPKSVSLFWTAVRLFDFRLFIFLRDDLLFSQLIYPQMAAYAQDFGTALSLLKFFMNVLLAGLAGFFAFLGYVFLLPAQEWIERRLRTRSWMKNGFHCKWPRCLDR